MPASRLILHFMTTGRRVGKSTTDWYLIHNEDPIFLRHRSTVLPESISTYLLQDFLRTEP